MSAGTYLLGLGLFAVVWGSAAACGVLVWRRLLPHLRGAPAVAAVAVVGYAALFVAHLGPGALGVLSRWSVAVVSLAILALAWWRLPRRVASAESLPPTKSPPLSWGLALVGAAVVAAPLLAVLGAQGDEPPRNFDWLAYQLPTIAVWMDTGSLFEFPTILPGYATASYPNTGDVTMLAAILPWSNASLVRFAGAPALAVTAIAVYGLGRELRAPAPTAVLVATVLVAVPNVWFPPVTNLKPDGVMLAMFACAVLFLVRHARTAATSDLLLAGVALGLAFGARWYGISVAVVVLAVWALVQLLARRRLGAVARDAGILGAATLLVGGFWLVRNAVATGNPLFPVKIDLLGVTLFDAPHDPVLDRFGHAIANYLSDLDIVTDTIWPAFRENVGLPGLTLALGAALALTMALVILRARREDGGRALIAAALIVSAGGIAVAYAITPASAQGLEGMPLVGLIGTNTRWLMPAFVLAAGATAWAVARLGRRRLVAEAVLFAVVIVAASRIDAPPHWIFAGAVGVLLLGAGAVLMRRAAVRRELRRPVVAGGLALTVSLVLAGIGQWQQGRYDDLRFSGIDQAVAWVYTNAPDGSRVGVAGNALTRYAPIGLLSGERFENDVSWVGPTRDSQLLNYEDRRAFTDALAADEYDLLVVFRAQGPIWEIGEGGFEGTEIAASLPPERWARQAGFEPVVRGETATLLAREGSPAAAAGTGLVRLPDALG